MASDPTSIFDLLNSTMSRLTNSPSTWTDFLRVAGRLYKYPFLDQVLIYAQRPDATACADYVVWNNTMRRFIRRGAKGIALIDDSGDKAKIHYVFDISDTGGRDNSRRPFVWEYLLMYEGTVTAALEQEYTVSSENGLVGQLEQIAKQIADEYWQNHQYDILQIVEGSLLEEYDEFNIGVQFRNAATVSITYALMSRCGLDPDEHFEHEDFQRIIDFNTPSALTALGTAVSEGSQRVLRQIEITIKKYEREHLMERGISHGEQSSLQIKRGLPDPRPDDHGANREHRQVREDAEKLPEGVPPSPVLQPTTTRGIVPSTAGDRSNGAYTLRANNAGADEVDGRDRGAEGHRSNAMGGPYEQSKSSGGRGYSDGAYIQLSLFPSEQEQIQWIDEAEGVTPSAFSIPQGKSAAGTYPVVSAPQIVQEGSQTTEDVDSIALRARMAQAGTAGGQVIDPAVLDNAPFIQQVMDDVVRIKQEQRPSDTAETPADNYRITYNTLGTGGAKAKFHANMDAVRVLQIIESEGRMATSEEQEILARYVGWGGLAEAFDDSKPTWAKEYKELRAVLSPEEYAAARASTLNAHYTSPTVIRGIYKAVSGLGFRAGNILEPSCGVGNFFGCLPEELRDSRLYGVELDSITGRIAKQLYPQADITVAGFETTDKRDFFDLAVGNVPFGQYQVNDRAYNKLGFSIHDYFFAKTLDQVRPGGVIAFVTSRYTMDKQSPEVRRYIAQRAELLGAIRLPNDAFKANAGTEVVSDIIFLQKRDRPIVTDPNWVHLGQTQDGFAINSYFIDHPEMVLGTPASENTQYGRQDYTVIPIPGADLADQLNEAVSHISGQYTESELPELSEGEKIDESIPADPSVKNYSYTVLNGEVYYRENSRMVRPDLNDTAKGRIKGMVELRDCVRQLIDLQMDEYAGDTGIHETQVELNRLHDAFSAQYGLINSRGNKLAFSDDSAYYLLCSLEVLDDDGNFERKADMFTKRTIRQQCSVTSVDTAAEALAVSIGEQAKVDLPFMARLSGLSEEQIKSDLKGVIFKDPSYGSNPKEGWQTADEYLSGNVRKKLRVARRAEEHDPAFQINVEALEKAQPKDLDASEIEVRLGATWIDKAYIQQFMEETFNTPNFLLGTIQVKYTAYTAEWQITNKSRISYNDVAANTTYGTDRASAYRILEDSLNLRDIRIYDTIEDTEGKERRVLNYKQTTLAEQKQQAIREAFRDWIWRDPERRQTLVTQYNEEMNSTRPREYDGRHLVLFGMNPEIVLSEHQKNAIAHQLYGGNTLLAHAVGAGKTFEMVGACMEGKHLGLSHKSIFAVPNHLIGQFASEFLWLYPAANLLVATEKDFETHNRKRFCARIATGAYDAVIIGHSQFERIPISSERQENLLQEQIWEVTEGISEVEASGGERFTVKQLERTKKGLEVRLEKLQASDRKDDVVTFEELGVDRLFVDESHNYKNLFLYTKMRNVAGLATTDAQKSSDMYAKCRYLDELTGNRGITFATGTPISNSMTELYTIQRYLQYARLKELGMTHFDCWASRFGETTTVIELAPEGTGYRARTRFAKFFNLPELMNLFREVADIKTADQLNLPVPEAVFHTVVAQPTEHQKAMVQALSNRAALVHSGAVDPSIDNMLKITSDGRKLGLDQRIINSMLPDEPQSKVNNCVDNVFHIWEEGQPEKLTQLVFCDISTPKAGTAKAAKAGDKTISGVELHALEHMTETLDIPNEPEFTVYADIRQKLLSRGVPAEQVAFIHDANTEVRKKRLFAKVRSGQVRVLIGSTFKMGAGTNVQDRLRALHDLDCPWRPGDLEQRKGRIVRQGNKNKTVDIYRYVTEGTFDSYLYQTIENKQKFISQIMTSKSPVRSCEDIDETALSYAEIKALCAGNPLIKERMDLEIEVSRLRLMRADHQSKQFRLEDNLIKYFPEQIEQSKGVNRGLQADIATLEAHTHPKDAFAGMEVCGDHFTAKEDAGVALLDACKVVTGRDPVQIGSYRGFTMQAAFDAFDQSYTLTLKGSVSHRVELGKDARGNLTRIDNALSLMPDHLKSMRSQLDNLYSQVEAAKLEVGKPFPQETEFQQKTARLAELNTELNMELAEGKSTLADDTGPIPDVYSDQAAEEEWEEEF